jgi:hypothetical protein
MAQPAAHDDRFEETRSHRTRLCDLRLTIQGTPLEPVIDAFKAEVEQLNLRVQPHFYLSTDWGVPFPSVSIGIPFYLAHPDLTALHADRVGHVEGVGRVSLLRYLRHEMGHVVNYAYRLYEQPEWIALFGAISQPYVEEYRPQPFSRRFVRHLPGWYGQKHPDEDWAETFAVWMTPGDAWRRDYAAWPDALAKLDYCDRTVRALPDPGELDDELDEDVGEIDYSLGDFYENLAGESPALPDGLDGALRTVFDDTGLIVPAQPGERLPAAALLARLERSLAAHVFVWTGHFPEKTRVLVRHLAQRAGALELSYARGGEADVTIALTTMLTALAMNHVIHGSYLP